MNKIENLFDEILEEGLISRAKARIAGGAKTSGKYIQDIGKALKGESTKGIDPRIERQKQVLKSYLSSTKKSILNNLNKLKIDIIKLLDPGWEVKFSNLDMSLKDIINKIDELDSEGTLIIKQPKKSTKPVVKPSRKPEVSPKSQTPSSKLSPTNVPTPMTKVKEPKASPKKSPLPKKTTSTPKRRLSKGKGSIDLMRMGRPDINVKPI